MEEKYAETYSEEMHKENIIKLCYYKNASLKFVGRDLLVH